MSTLTSTPSDTPSPASAAQDELLRLLRHASKGDQSAFQALYRQTSARLYAVALRLLRRRDWADEVMQEAYVRIWHNASEYVSERGHVLTWMISILRYRAIDRIRRERARGWSGDTHDGEDEEAASEDDNPLLLLQSHRRADQLNNCMNGLREEQRQCIASAFFDGYTHEELSERLQTPLGTIKSWVRRGLQALRRCLEQ